MGYPSVDDLMTLVLWEPTPGPGHRSQEGATIIWGGTLKKDTGAETAEEIASCMEDLDGWRPRWDVCL